MWHKHIHHLLNDTVFNVETHLGKTTKALFIWHEKYMAPLVCALSCRLCFRYSSLIYTNFSILSCFLVFCRSIFSYLNLLLIYTYPRSTTLLYTSMHSAADFVLDIYSFIHTYLFLLSRSPIFCFSTLPLLNSTNDLHTAWIDSTFSMPLLSIRK